MRKMASIRTIDEIRAHTNADALELAVIGGWQCVVKKGEFVPGEQVVYFEIDSWIPTEIAAFLSKGKEPREFEGVPGERLKTIRLRGEVSQGLVLPLSVIPREVMDQINEDTRYTCGTCLGTGVIDERLGGYPQSGGPVTCPDCGGDELFSSIDGWDVTEVLGVKKWEKAMAANMRGNARRYFPNFIQKTDQERVQNMLRTLEKRDPDEVYEVTLKMDGSSTSFYVYPNAETGEIETGVCSRNLELKTDESNAENLFVQMYRKLGIDQRLKDFHEDKGRNIALQGELWGVGINGNWEGVQDVSFHVFDVFDCDRYKYVDAPTRYNVLERLNRYVGMERIHHVPVIGHGTLKDFGVGSLRIEDFLAFANRPSMYNPIAEGVVFKSLTDPNFSFKVINNKYLLGGGDDERVIEDKLVQLA